MRASATAAAAACCGDYYYCDTETGRRYCFEPKSHGVHLFATTSTLICDICFDGHPQICLGCSHLAGVGARADLPDQPERRCALYPGDPGPAPAACPYCGMKQNQLRVTQATVSCASPLPARTRLDLQAAISAHGDAQLSVLADQGGAGARGHSAIRVDRCAARPPGSPRSLASFGEPLRTRHGPAGGAAEPCPRLTYPRDF